MNDAFKQFNKIIVSAREDIAELERKLINEAKDESSKEKIRLIGINYEVVLSSLVSFRDEIEAKINVPSKIDTKGIKIVLDNDPTSVEEENDYVAKPGVFVTDNEPVIIKTKTGKKIVLDEDPVAYISPYGHKIDIEEPDLTRTGKKITSSKIEDKVGGTGKKFTSSKIEDTLTGKVINSDKLEETLTGKVINNDKLEETLTGHVINNDKLEETLTGHVIVLDEDPSSVILRSGKKIILDEDALSKKILTNHVIVLDEDELMKSESKIIVPEKKRLTGKKIELDEEPIEISIVEE